MMTLAIQVYICDFISRRSLISWIYYTKNWHHHHPNQVAPVLMLRSLHSQMNHQILETEQFLHRQSWWGAHNRGWNPPMNLI